MLQSFLSLFGLIGSMCQSAKWTEVLYLQFVPSCAVGSKKDDKLKGWTLDVDNENLVKKFINHDIGMYKYRMKKCAIKVWLYVSLYVVV